MIQPFIPSPSSEAALRCPVCKEYLNPPVSCCSNSHNYCSTCTSYLNSYSYTEKLCVICTSPFSPTTLNHSIETILSVFCVNCIWAKYGCLEQVTLLNRVTHKNICKFKPLVSCYFYRLSGCDWKGRAEDLLRHLLDIHQVQEKTRNSDFMYLWGLPNKDLPQFKCKIIRKCYDAEREPLNFVLEYYYCEKQRLARFMLRGVTDTDKRKYKISVVNRADNRISLSFEGFSTTFHNHGEIHDFFTNSFSDLLIIPYAQLSDFSFFCSEDNCNYFSITLQVLN